MREICFINKISDKTWNAAKYVNSLINMHLRSLEIAIHLWIWQLSSISLHFYVL